MESCQLFTLSTMTGMEETPGDGMGEEIKILRRRPA
jgi:hypothetical protein